MLNKYNTELGRDLMTIIFLRTIDFIETTIENQKALDRCFIQHRTTHTCNYPRPVTGDQTQDF